MLPDVNSDTFRLLIPEIILVVMAAWIFVAGAFTSGQGPWRLFAIVGMLFVAFALYNQDTSLKVYSNQPLFDTSGPLLVDAIGHSMRWLAWLSGLLLVLLSSRATNDGLRTEYLGALLLIVAGLMLSCTTGEMVTIFVSLELISIPTYILLFLGHRGASPHEAAMKYFFLSIASSALFLYGLSFLYGIAGGTQLSQLQVALATPGGADPVASGLIPVAMLLVLAGLGFKIAAVPFHFYAPDVYQGASSGNAGLLAVVPKIAGVLVLVRFLAAVAPSIAANGWTILLVLAAITMTVGNVTALWQTNVRRLMAYSSIAHAGYLLIGLAVAAGGIGGAEATSSQGLGATLFYLVTYVIATLGTFAAFAFLGNDESDISSLDDLAGLGTARPVIALTLAVFMFSLAGIPPLAGFFGKLSLFLGALSVDRPTGLSSIHTWFVVLAIIGALNAAISAAYYLRVVATMYFRPATRLTDPDGGLGAGLAAILAAILVIAVGVSPGTLSGRLLRASRSFAADSPSELAETISDIEVRLTQFKVEESR
ncbi:MAG: NADH-quinone oxidoreductase subunit N [Planctomycetales bacterium]|nr:NADH-quinone oxidoreductase subunit N [Planctomycetales bacterium]